MTDRSDCFAELPHSRKHWLKFQHTEKENSINCSWIPRVCIVKLEGWEKELKASIETNSILTNYSCKWNRCHQI